MGNPRRRRDGRPDITVERATACDAEVQQVLAAAGHEAGQYHVLSPDPWWVMWNDDRSGFVAFLEDHHCIFAWRSPVAAAGMELDIISRLQYYARIRRKTLIAALVNEATCRAGIQLGMKPIWIGSETFHHLPDWSIEGGRRQKLRWARNHAKKLGYSWREVFPIDNDAERAALEHTERKWKQARVQRSTDSFQRTSYAELTEIRRYFACIAPATENASESIVAFMACTPTSDEGWYLQDPVRLESAPRGALEGCIAMALDALRDDGFKTATNGPLPFWRPEDQPANEYGLGPLGRRVVDFFDRQYRFKGIAQFRTKLDPDRVEPLYILLSRRMLSPLAARSLVRVLTKRLPS